MPNELTIEIFEADFSAHLVAWSGKSHAQDAVEEGSIAAVY